MTKELTTKTIEILLPKIFEHPILYPVLLTILVLGGVLLPPLILMFTNKKLIKSEIIDTIKPLFNPFTTEINTLKTCFSGFIVEQEQSNSRNEAQHSLVLFSIQELAEKVEGLESPEVLEGEMSRTIFKGLSFVKNNKLRIDCTEYMTAVKNTLVENFRHHNVTGFNELCKDDNAYMLGMDEVKRKFLLIFGDDHHNKYYKAETHFYVFLDTVDRIAKLNANSKKERYITALKSLLDEIIAKLVDYSIREILLNNKYK